MPAIEPDTPHPPAPPTDPVPTVRPAAGVSDDFEYVDNDADGGPPRRTHFAPSPLKRWVRVMLALMAAGFVTLLVTAACLNPYVDGDRSSPRRMATHTQLGLQPCSMVVLTGKPCPACGMTTSFSLLAHGDVPNSLRANWVGTLLAAAIALLAPWAVVGAVRGRLPWVRNGELFATVLLSGLLVLMMTRWLFVLFG